MHRSPFHGKIDLLAENKNNGNVSIVIIPEKNTFKDVYNGYFKLSKYTSLSILHYFINNF